MHQIVRRSLLAAGGTLLAGAVAGKYLRAEDGGGGMAPAPVPALQPVASLKPAPAAVLPALRFTLADGSVRGLSDYAGKGVVLNFWATWCGPCVAEMAGLDALCSRLASQNIVVLAVSEDRGGASAVRSFYAARGIRNLPLLLDTQMQAMAALRLDGIPTTLVIDRKGREVSRIQGAVGWDVPGAPSLIGRIVGS